MTAERLRLFVAVSVPDVALHAAADAIEPVKRQFPGARWVELDNQHVTLKFLGWTGADALDGISAAVGDVARAHRPAQLSLGVLDAFPNRNRVRVLWLGLDDPAGALGAIAGALDGALEPLGFSPEERAFTPHLTLARFKEPLRMRTEWPAVDVNAAPWTVTEITLWRSHLSPKGPRYEILDEVPLGGEQRAGDGPA